jgi:hypothetical protein
VGTNEETTMETRNGIMATTLMAVAAAGNPADDTTARVILSRIVEADAAAMELNGLLNRGVDVRDRYEAAANDRDDAIDAAARFLGH